MLKQILRRLARAPMFTAVCRYSRSRRRLGRTPRCSAFINGVLLKPLPYPDPDRLAAVWQAATNLKLDKFEISPSEYFIFCEDNRTFEHFGLWTGFSVTVTGLAEPEQVRGLSVTDGTLQALGIQPILGHWFSEKEI